VFGKDGGMSIEDWEKTTLGWATFVQRMGVQMGNLSSLGITIWLIMGNRRSCRKMSVGRAVVPIHEEG